MFRILFVPGADVATHDMLPGTNTEKRLIEALGLWYNGEYDWILVSGGIYLSQDIQSTPAGSLMKRWLINRRVPADKIIVEDNALDTYQNINLGIQALCDKGINASEAEITVVTQWQHAFRVAYTFLAVYGIEVKRHGVGYCESAKSWLMEWVMLAYHHIDREGKGRFAVRNRESRRTSTIAPV